MCFLLKAAAVRIEGGGGTEGCRGTDPLMPVSDALHLLSALISCLTCAHIPVSSACSKFFLISDSLCFSSVDPLT